MSPRVQPRRSARPDPDELTPADLEFRKQHAAVMVRAKSLSEELRIEEKSRSPYGPKSEHSWVRDSVLTAGDVKDPAADERLGRFHNSMREHRDAYEAEMRAVTTGTLGGLIPSAIRPYIAQAIAYGVRSTAPLAAALERLDLPPVGMNVPWAKVTTGATVTNQTAENAALTASADVVDGSVTDPIKTIAAYADFSAQTQELSGGWWDVIIAEELGRAFGARLEAQLWNGSGASGQLTGFAVMSGNSSSTVAGQTLANQSAKIADQFQQVANNLGSVPDVIAMAPRRYAGLQSLTAALGLPAENVLPASVRDNVVISPAAPTNLGGGTNEDWVLLINRAAVPLVRDQSPKLELHRQGPSAGTVLTFRWLIYAYVSLGVSRRPEGVGIVKGATAPAF